MKNNTLISVRSNCDFSLDYKEGTLNPKTEVILITTRPVYKLNKAKTELLKEQEVEEFRFYSDLVGINKLIGELQIVVKNMNNFEQTAASLNAVIKSSQSETK